MTNLEQKTLQAINESMQCKKYIGDLKVIKEDNDYTLFLYLDQEQSPMVFSKECIDENDFLEFIKKEIKTRKVHLTSYWGATKEIPSVECEDGELELDDSYIPIW